MTEHPLITDYRERLHAAAGGMPADDRAELLADLDAHLHEIGERHAGDEAGLRSALDRLGAPADVVGADDAPAARPPERSRDLAGFAVAGMVLLLVGGITAPIFVGWFLWVAGLVMLATASRITARERLTGLLLLGSGPFVAYALLMSTGVTTCSSVNGGPEVCDSPPHGAGYWIWLAVAVGYFGAQIAYVMAVSLRVRRRGHAAASTAAVAA